MLRHLFLCSNLKTGIYTGMGFVFIGYFWRMRETVNKYENISIVLKYYERLCKDKCEIFIYLIVHL